MEPIMKPARLSRVFVIALTFLVVAVSGQNGPSIPSWVHPGLTVTYDGVSAFVRNGQFSQSVQVVMTTRVTSMAGGRVSGSTLFQTVSTPLRGSHLWTCTSTGNCSGDATRFSRQ